MTLHLPSPAARSRTEDAVGLLGRARECERIDAVLREAVQGRTASLVLRGPPGIGKTSLLRYAAARAGEMQVLEARGIEAESELPYAGLLELLLPVLSHLDALEGGQRATLRTALALDPGPTPDPVAVYAATLSVLAAAAQSAPVVVLVDDAHWLDRGSADALAFVARRAHSEPIATIWAVREGEGADLRLDGVPELRLDGLDGTSARELLSRVEPGIATSAVEALVARTAGNALALIELPGMLTDSQRRGAEPIEEPLPAGPSIQRAFGRRIEALPAPARAALTVAAAHDADDVATLATALRELALTLEDLGHAEAEDLVRIASGRFRFRHPLVRAAAYALAGPAERRAAHRALAEATAGQAATDRRLWHLAQAALEPDAELAAELEAAGDRARGRSWRAAARAYERAAGLSPDGRSRARRLLEAANAWTLAGLSASARALVDEAVQLDHGPDLAVRAARLRARMRIESPTASVQGLVAAAKRIQDRDPEQAALALMEAVDLLVGPDMRARRRQALEEADRLARQALRLPWPRGGFTELMVRLRHGDVLGWLGEVEQAQAAWLEAAEVPVGDDPEGLSFVGEALFSAGQDERGVRSLRRAVHVARDCGAPSVLPNVLRLLVLAESRAGHLVEARAAAAEWLDLAAALGLPGERADALIELAWMESLLGHESACRDNAAEGTELLRALGVGMPRWDPSGTLELSLGNWEAAAALLEPPLDVRGVTCSSDAIAPRSVVPLLIEAQVRLGRVEEARAALDEYTVAAERSGRSHARALALRCRGIVEDDPAAFEQALAAHATWGNPFEEARTALVFGALLRRGRRRIEARTQLRRALEGFERSGARIWAERAREELAATGERARRRDPSTADDLTPQELQVVRLVAEGLTNREVAAKLFLSPKTIETHLGSAFRKLQVRSRTELAVLVAAQRLPVPA